MRTSYEIYCDYMKAMAKAATLENVAQNLQRTSESLLEEKNTLSGSWQGNPMNVVGNKSYEISNDLRRHAGKIRDIATVIRRIARRNYDAEMSALELARNREYGASGFGGGGGGGGAR